MTAGVLIDRIIRESGLRAKAYSLFDVEGEEMSVNWKLGDCVEPGDVLKLA